jgi:hypothetical protein
MFELCADEMAANRSVAAHGLSGLQCTVEYVYVGQTITRSNSLRLACRFSAEFSLLHRYVGSIYRDACFS